MSNEQAFNAAVTASEGQKQTAIAAASHTGDEFEGLLRAAEQNHWQRCADAATKFGMSATVYLEALAFRARGV